MTPKGEGMAKIKGFPVFIGNAKPKEHLKIKITNIDSGCADAEIVPYRKRRTGLTAKLFLKAKMWFFSKLVQLTKLSFLKYKFMHY